MKAPRCFGSHSSAISTPDPAPPRHCLKVLTTQELVRSIGTVGEGVALLLDEDALATGAPELIGQTDSCGDKGAVLRGGRHRAAAFAWL